MGDQVYLMGEHHLPTVCLASRRRGSRDLKDPGSVSCSCPWLQWYRKRLLPWDLGEKVPAPRASSSVGVCGVPTVCQAEGSGAALRETEGSRAEERELAVVRDVVSSLGLQELELRCWGLIG